MWHSLYQILRVVKHIPNLIKSVGNFSLSRCHMLTPGDGELTSMCLLAEQSELVFLYFANLFDRLTRRGEVQFVVKYIN